MHRIHRKSVYHRKYHIENVLNSLCYENRVELTYHQRNRIYKVFDEIGTILPLVNGSRKRMMSVNFIIVKILKMMKLSHSYVKVTKSKRTLSSYERYWDQIISMIGDKIKEIIK